MCHCRLTLLLALALPCTLQALEEPAETARFEFDPADTTVPARMLDGELRYDADLARGRDGLWMTWLEFVPDEGDEVWIAREANGQWVDRTRVSAKPGRYAHPTLTADSEERLWLTFEVEGAGGWRMLAGRQEEGGKFGSFQSVGTVNGFSINHRAAPARNGGLWVVWQGTTDGRFRIYAARVHPGSEPLINIMGDSESGGCWSPDVVATQQGGVVVAWDGFDGESFNVYARRLSADGHWGDPITVAETPAYEARPRLAAGADGQVWIAWEEGGENWGRPYTSQMRLKSPDSIEIHDTHGPLHRLRRQRLAVLGVDGGAAVVDPALPMPALARAEQRQGAPRDVKHVGVFYEAGVPVVDGGGRLWMLYRHRYVPYMGMNKTSHIDDGWGLYVRQRIGEGWSPLRRLEIGQGDGMQRIEVLPGDEGFTALWTTGRTDRRDSTQPRGLAWATIGDAAGQEPPAPGTSSTAPARPLKEPALKRAATLRSTVVAGRPFRVFFGDLHRHTDLSLCYSPVDGTIEETYRYAIEVARLDFLGITDHSRDIAQGDVHSQLWWRSTKEVTRHDLSPVFMPMFAYERSRTGSDHNVISLRPDMLRPFTYPHPEFWKELDNDTLTIPHQTITPPIPDEGPPPLTMSPDTWEAQDNVHRPLMEIYQGCRDRSIERDAHNGLGREYLLGFIASSDHLATQHGYACVWAPWASRESIFRSMQARRTYGATAPIRLKVLAGEHWMGERFAARAFPKLDIEAAGTAAIERIELVVDGEVRQTVSGSEAELRLSLEVPPLADGFHYAYVRLTQSDGHRAWSSPIWVDVSAAAQGEAGEGTAPRACCPEPKQGPVPGT